MALVIGTGITIGGGISIVEDSNLIPAGSLTAQSGLQLYFTPTLYFVNSTFANQFKTASPSVFYVIDNAGGQTKFDGVTLGAVTPSGPYSSITVSGGTITTGTYLSGASNSTIYY